MKRHLINATCGVFDYAAYPVAMLFVGPYALHRLGAENFGVWMMAGAIISCGGIIASGFSDAYLQRLAQLLGAGGFDAARQTTRNVLSINLTTGILVALVTAVCIPLLVRRVQTQHGGAVGHTSVCFWIAAGCIPLRALHSAAVSTQRAFQDFRYSVKVTTFMHLSTLSSAAVLCAMGFGPVAILLVTVTLLFAATVAQLSEVARLLGGRVLIPTFHREHATPLFSRGFFVWIQTLGAVAADRVDRLLLGAALGPAALAPYVLCLQVAQPLVGLTGSGLSFLMPHFASASAAGSARFRRTALAAIALNLGIVGFGGVCLLHFGPALLRHWLGQGSAFLVADLFPRLLLASALLASSVTCIYLLQAWGSFRLLAAVSLGTRLLLLPLMLRWLHQQGVHGLANFRLVSALIALLVYVPVVRRLVTPEARALSLLPTNPPLPTEGGVRV